MDTIKKPEDINQPRRRFFWHGSSDDRFRSVGLEQLCRGATKQSGAGRCALDQTGN